MSDFGELGTPKELVERVVIANKKLQEGDPSREIDFESRELVEACMDTIFVAFDGKYWDKLPRIGIEFPKDDKSVSNGLRGTSAELVPLLPPTDEESGKFILGIRGRNRKNVMDHHLYMEVDFTDEGHHVVRGAYSLMADSGVKVQDLYTALASISITTLVKSME